MEYLIHHLESDYLRKYSESFIAEFLSIYRNQQNKYVPFKKNPKHYILSMYEPLSMSYVVLGSENYVIDLNYVEDTLLTQTIDKYCSINNSDKTTFRRQMEYLFLNSCLKNINKIVGKEIQLYLTQHITEISYNVSDMKEIQCDELMDILED